MRTATAADVPAAACLLADRGDPADAVDLDLVVTSEGYEGLAVVVEVRALMAWAHERSRRKGHLLQVMIGSGAVGARGVGHDRRGGGAAARWRCSSEAASQRPRNPSWAQRVTKATGTTTCSVVPAADC